MQDVDISRSPAVRSKPFNLISVLVVLLLLWIAAAVTLSQLQMAPTFDEQNHVTRGIAILRTGDFRLSLDHPPLANMLEALPVAWQPSGFSTNMPAWRDISIWEAAKATIWTYPRQGLRLIRDARPMVLIFTLGLALLIFFWAKSLFGPWGGLLAMALYGLDPSMLAHGGLATTDMAAACTMMLALFLLRHYLNSPSRWRMLLAGAGLGLALTAKFSTLLMLPIIGLILLAIALRRSGDTYPTGWPQAAGKRFFHAAGVYLAILCVSGLVVWGVYGFQVEALGSKPGRPVAVEASAKEHFPIPAMQYLRGIKSVMTNAETHPAYLLGRTDSHGKGWWYYFPVAMAVKTPLPELLAILGILVVALIPRLRARLRLSAPDWLLLLVPAGFYFLAALGVFGVSLNLGIRHLMPLYPFLLVLAGGWVLVFTNSRLRAVVVCGSLLVVQLISVCFAYPQFLAYFNEPARMLAKGRPLLIDSNIDWGQDVGRLAEYQYKFQAKDNLGTLYFSYFGSVSPEAYGLRCQPLAGLGIMREAPPPDWSAMHGTLAISLTNLYGGAGYAGADYRPLLREHPFGIIGKTIYLYHVPLGQRAKNTR